MNIGYKITVAVEGLSSYQDGYTFCVHPGSQKITGHYNPDFEYLTAGDDLWGGPSLGTIVGGLGVEQRITVFDEAGETWELFERDRETLEEKVVPLKDVKIVQMDQMRITKQTLR